MIGYPVILTPLEQRWNAAWPIYWYDGNGFWWKIKP
jgi:hypothetical protein